MGPWPGRREISDLLYEDQSGMLTAHLINAGYLDRHVWAGATPRYLIEVKTTTGNYDDRFFMSSNQFRLVGKRFHLSHSRLFLTPTDARISIGTRAGFPSDICDF